MDTGKVKFFDASKGFGFIVPDNGGQDVFVHVSESYNGIKEGDRVIFGIKEGKKGEAAAKVRLAK